MNKPTIIKVYNFVDRNGSTLRLTLGSIRADYANTPDENLRWRFNGSRIPMPVRAGTWFVGLPKDQMVQWLKDHGWVLTSSVDMATGAVNVHEVPDYSFDEEVVGEAIRAYYAVRRSTGRCARLYKLAFGVDAIAAVKRVKTIIEEVH